MSYQSIACDYRDRIIGHNPRERFAHHIHRSELTLKTWWTHNLGRLSATAFFFVLVIAGTGGILVAVGLLHLSLFLAGLPPVAP